MRSGMDHAFPIFPCFDKVIKPVLGSFPRFCPQLSFEQGCGVPPNYIGMPERKKEELAGSIEKVLSRGAVPAPTA